jgi:hypothetical protein
MIPSQAICDKVTLQGNAETDNSMPTAASHHSIAKVL